MAVHFEKRLVWRSIASSKLGFFMPADKLAGIFMSINTQQNVARSSLPDTNSNAIKAFTYPTNTMHNFMIGPCTTTTISLQANSQDRLEEGLLEKRLDSIKALHYCQNLPYIGFTYTGQIMYPPRLYFFHFRQSDGCPSGLCQLGPCPFSL